MIRTISNWDRNQRGAALLVVLMSLALLFSLGVPFLFTGQKRAEAARESYDRSRARVGVSSAGEHVRWMLADTHPALDSTPWWDAQAEWQSDGLAPLPQALGGAWANSNESWGVETESAQSLVSLATASPLLLQNLLHPCFLAEDASFEDSSLSVTSTEGFPDAGFVLMGASWVEYQSKTSNSFDEISAAPDLPDDLSATRYREGQAVIDQRILNLVLARMRFGEQRAPEFFDDVFSFDFGDPNTPLLPEGDRRQLADLCWLSTGAFGEARMQPAVWASGPPPEQNPNYLPLQDASAFSTGTMVRIENPLIGLSIDSVVLSGGRGGIMIPQALPAELDGWTTRAIPFRRDPVDINSCRREILEAMVLGLRFNGGPNIITTEPPSGFSRRHYVSRSKAQRFADMVIRARPIEGPDDLWARVLQPAERRGELSHADVWSIHLNGLDPNHGNLAASTTGFAYRSGDRFVQRVSAAHRSRLGRTLSRASAVQDVQVAPSGPLLQVWETQQDFEEAGRYARGLHKVVSLPNARGRLGGHSDGQNPDGLTLRVGSYGPTPFAPESDDPELSALLPMPAEDHWQGYNGRVEHFPAEPSPLGWHVGEQGPRPDTLENFNIAIDGETGGNDDVPLTMQGWFRMPEFGATDGVLFEIGGDYVDRQRIVAAFEEGSLFVRAFDNAGDDPGDEDNLEQALTIEIDPSEYPLENRWFHVGMLLRSVRPGGVQAIIDGVPRGETHGFTKLTGALSGFAPGDTDPSIGVESTEGFPSRGVIQIGEEVIEYSSKTENSFVTSRVESADGYIGGRAARQPSDSAVNLLDTVHPEGAGVELYGYSALATSDIPPGGATLTGAVGPWSVAQVIEGEEEVSVFFTPPGVSFRIGYGVTGSYTGTIELAPAEATDNYYAECFQETGGYALMMQRRVNAIDDGGHNIGGFEIIRYSERQGTTLTISERQVATPLSQPLYDDDNRAGAGVSFVTEWEEWVTGQDGTLWRDDPAWRVFIMPISIAGDSVTDFRYLIPNENNSEFVQITNESDAGLTEWVRYDSILDGYFLRDDPAAMINAVNQPLFDNNYKPNDDLSTPPPGSGGGVGGGGGGGGAGNVGGGGGAGNVGGGGLLATWQEPGNDNLFTRRIGTPVEDRPTLIRDIMNRYQFRGVMGTEDHEHLGGEDLVPVFRTRRAQFATPEAGQVGRLDRVAIMDPTASEAPFWFTVQWATAPFPINEPRVLGGHTYVAFSRSTGIPYALTELEESDELEADSRDYLRIVKFPSGERPNGLRSVFLGSSSNGAGGVFGGEVDEVVVGEPAGMPQANGLNRSAFVLSEDLESGDDTVIRINPNFVIVDSREVYAQSTGQFIQQLPEAGLLWIDGEIIAYNGLNAGEGELEIAPDGRGLLGTEPGGHASGTRAWAADMRPVAFLNNGISPGESQIQLNNSRGFGPHSLLLIDDELLHAPTLPGGNVMTMDRYPEDADNPDSLTQRGDGLFRGAFGTTASAHSTGAMIYSMPTRWLDLYAPRQNSQESAWYQLGLVQPGAFWQGLYFEAEEEDASHQVMVLARSGNASWEDDPESTPGLVLIDRQQMPDGSAVPLNLNADNLELRVLFDWTVGAFDPVEFLANGWTIAPRLRHLRLEYLAESRVTRSQEVHE